MACQFNCVYKDLALEAQEELKSIVERDEPFAQQKDEEARRGWGDRASRRIQDRRHEELGAYDATLEIDGLLCTDKVCGFALESVRKRIEEISIDIKLKRERL